MDITEYAMMKKVFKKLSPDSDPVLQEKTITENGEYTPDDGYDGLSKVIVNVAGGGGGSADLVYVTFKTHDGAKELHKRAVVKGNTCMCPVTGAIKEIDTPTRESTELYRYIFGGWSTTPNGALDESALEAITADKTVYAYFTAVTRFYTVNFYDGDTLLNTKSVVYGGLADYTPEKEGWQFEGWEPSNANITADTDCYAQWSEKITFANATWSQIAEISEAGEAEKYFAIGDTKQVAYGDDYFTVAIADFNHDDLADGSGKAGISIVCTTLPDIKRAWNGKTSWVSYVNSLPYLYTLPTILSGLPTELQAVIKPVNKLYDTSGNGGKGNTSVSENSLWLLSIDEMGYDWSDSYAADNFNTLGSRYPIFDEGNIFSASAALEQVSIGTTGNTSLTYWTRSSPTNIANAVCFIMYSGVCDRMASQGAANNLTLAKYMRFGFCV